MLSADWLQNEQIPVCKTLVRWIWKVGQMANLNLLLTGTYKASFLPTELQYGLTHTIIDLKTSFIMIVL